MKDLEELDREWRQRESVLLRDLGEAITLLQEWISAGLNPGGEWNLIDLINRSTAVIDKHRST